MVEKDLVIVGGGPAGMAAAIAAHENGIKDILLLERDQYLGGILNQCIHPGFGIEYFEELLTGPEYAGRFIKKTKNIWKYPCRVLFAIATLGGLPCYEPSLWRLITRSLPLPQITPFTTFLTICSVAWVHKGEDVLMLQFYTILTIE